MGCGCGGSSKGERPQRVARQRERRAAAIQDPGGGRESAPRRVRPPDVPRRRVLPPLLDDPDTEMEQWEMLSTDELRIQDGHLHPVQGAVAERPRSTASRATTTGSRSATTEAVAYRLWQRTRATRCSPTRRCRASSTSARSCCSSRTPSARAPARASPGRDPRDLGDFSYAPLEPSADEDIRGGPVPRRPDVNAMMAAIVERGLRVRRRPARRARPDRRRSRRGSSTSRSSTRRSSTPRPASGECIERIAIGLDMPPEILIGLQDANHWTAWQIDEQTWKATASRSRTSS
jgi:hypothetical protein